MSNDLWQPIKEAIKLGLNVAEIYLGFHRGFRVNVNQCAQTPLILQKAFYLAEWPFLENS